MKINQVVSKEAWIEERKKLLIREKALNKERDEISAVRRKLPWVKVESNYVFEGKNGKTTMKEMFEGRSQLIVYHFMYGPDWKQPCKSCSFWADQFERNVVHMKQRDITMVAISRASTDQISAIQERLGWTFPWYSSGENSFNYDFNVSFTEEQIESGNSMYNYTIGGGVMDDLPGVSVYAMGDDGEVYHTYSSFSRGLDPLNSAYQFIDLTPKGRDEDNLSYGMEWLRIRDEY